MNLVAYDKIKSVVDKTKTWIDIPNKMLVSREIKYRKYVSFGKRYNKDEEHSDLYVIMLNDKPLDRACCKVLVDNYGRIKINIKSIFNEFDFPDDIIAINANVRLDETDNDGEIYCVTI